MDNKIICNNCNTQIGTRQNINYLNDDNEDKDKDEDNDIDIDIDINHAIKAKNKQETTNCNHKATQSNVEQKQDESDIWTLISSDFSTLRAPSLHIDDNDQEELFASVDSQKLDCNQELNDEDDKNAYLYHLTNVLPGLV